MSRVGRGAPTGIDRVERAYLDHLLDTAGPLWLLARTADGYVLLDRAGGVALRDRLDGRVPWGAPDLAGRLSRRLEPARRAAESDLRRLALARAPRWRLRALLARHLPKGIRYLNTGHSHLGPRTFSALAALPGAAITVLVHDTIPLDHPRWQRPETAARFAADMARVSRHATRVIYSTEAARRRAEAHFAGFGRVPPGLVAPLGVDRPVPRPAELPPGLPPRPPYFVALGTIEPRKNIDLLLDVWERLVRAEGDAAPRLVVAGRRGWAGAALLARLDAAPAQVIEAPDLGDGAVAALLEGSAGLLFPSRAEGYGLPPIEAAALGVPVLVADLPVYRETLGDYPVYADPDDVYFWLETITKWARRMQAEEPGRGGSRRREPPSWQDHFNLVLSAA